MLKTKILSIILLGILNSFQSISYANSQDAINELLSQYVEYNNKERINNLNQDGYIVINGQKIPLTYEHIIVDQNGCVHYNPKPLHNKKVSITWGGDCKNGLADGGGRLELFVNGIKQSSNIVGMLRHSFYYEKTKKEILEAYNQKTKNSRPLCEQIVSAAWEGKSNRVKTLLQKGVDPNNCVHEKMSPLFAAARYGRSYGWDRNIKTVKLLVEHGADINFRVKLDDGIYSIVYIAAMRGHTKTAIYLVSKGANSEEAEKGIREYAAREAGGLAALGLLAKAAKSFSNSLSNSSSTSSSSSNSYCGDNDTCYSGMRKRTSGSYGFTCTKGAYKGSNKCVSYDPDPSIKHPYGECGVPYSYEYKTLHKAANGKCR